MHRLGLRLVELVALALNLPRFSLHSLFTRPIEVLRLLHYSSRQSDPSAGLFGAGAHTDYGFLTLLSTDGKPGLEVLVDGNAELLGHDAREFNARSSTPSTASSIDGLQQRWTKVFPDQYDFVVNVGDFLNCLSDGEYVFGAATERVLHSFCTDLQLFLFTRFLRAIGRFRSATHRVVSTGVCGLLANCAFVRLRPHRVAL